MGVNNIVQLVRNTNNEHIRNTQPAKKQQEGAGDAERVNLQNEREFQAEEAAKDSAAEIKSVQTKAFFAVTEDKNVVIRIVDSEGNVLRQIPPEEYLKTAEFLKHTNKNLFSVEV